MGDENPFTWDGRPVEIIQSELGELHQLCEFVDGHWKTSDDFVLLPKGVAFYDKWIYQNGDDIHLLAYKVDDFESYYRAGLPTGTKQEAADFAKRHPHRLTQLTDNQLGEIGWERVHDASADPSNQDAPFHRPPFGFWFENSRPCAIGFEANEHDVLGFRWCRYRADSEPESMRIESPIRWGQTENDVINGTGWFNVVTPAEGDMYVVSCNVDGRMHILKWEKGHLRVIAQRGSPLIYKEVLETGPPVGLVIALPMFVLGLATWFLQRRWRCSEFSFAHETVSLASGLRRGIARMVDISILLTFLALSVIFHPDAIGWWHQMESVLWLAQNSLQDLIAFPDWSSFEETRVGSVNLFRTLVSVPFLWWLFVPAVLFLLAQIIWQARTGRTLGKWLLGVKALRTTLRPCGLARSLLRELLLVIDSCLLLSWVPGVVSILATRNSQRIGDLLADTIVVRDSLRHHNSNEPAIKPNLSPEIAQP